jgi:polysaccharide deacetylase family protein (PEP-CTERM system associated)
VGRSQDHGHAGSAAPGDAHFLSFDVEEYFQVEGAARCGVGPQDWPNYANRLPPAVDRILQALDDHRTSATFFVLGWVAEHEPDVVRRIAAAGHEVASHGMTHQMLQHLAPDPFRRELLDSRRILEDLTGRPVVGYRAPTFSITHETAWALDVLAETGYRYDSSVFPVRHDRYGVPGAPRVVHRATGPGGGSVLEIPPLTLRLAWTNWPVGGGGYLRLLPVRAVAWALRAAERRRQPGMLYLHPWELDPEQPILPMPSLSCWRHRVGLAKTEAKLRWLLGRFRFCAVADRLDAISDPVRETYAYGSR